MLNKNGQRELAYVVRVNEIKPIAGKDRVECAVINGWTVMVRKDQFKVNDLGIYFEVDSKCPETEPFKFLENKHYKIKIQKYKTDEGPFYSQGLLMGAEDFGWELTTSGQFAGDEPIIKTNDNKVYAEGDFLTEALNITHIVDEDNPKKSNKPEDKYKRMAQDYPNIFKKPFVRWLYKHNWGKKILSIFFKPKKKSDTSFPNQFPFIKKTDQERCLFAKTMIKTDKGEIEISKIVNNQMDVKVLSMNEYGTLSYKRILDYQKFENKDDVLTITYPYSLGTSKTNSIVCTSDHRFFTQRGYVHAKDLKLSDSVYMISENYQEDCIGAIYGMLLGDSHIYNDKRSKGKLRIITTNGEAQLDYLRYKQNIFGGEGKICDAGKGNFGTERTVYHWFLPVDGYINSQIKQDFYINGKKTVTKEACNKINAIGLAFWYMDDGNLSYREDPTQNPSIRINTQGFTKEENDLLCDMLNNHFGVSSHVTRERRKDKSDYYHIYIDVEGTPKFLELITPYMCESMKYKTTPKYEHLIETKVPNYTKKLRVLPIPILNIELGQRKYKKLPIKPQYVYDLEVEDNHNFISANIVSHNCENMVWVLQDKTPFIVTQKCDGSSATYILERQKKGKKEEFKFYVCSRNVNLLKPDQDCYHDKNYYWECAEKYDIKNKLQDYLNQHDDLDYICWQGEICAPGIQGNPHNLKETHLYCFHMIDSKKGKYDIRDAAKIWKEYDMEVVPITGELILPDDLEDLKIMADGYYDASVCEGQSNCKREGFVYYKTTDPNFSFKNVSREYLLKHS